jgi:hypothetical protein
MAGEHDGDSVVDLNLDAGGLAHGQYLVRRPDWMRRREGGNYRKDGPSIGLLEGRKERGSGRKRAEICPLPS